MALQQQTRNQISFECESFLCSLSPVYFLLQINKVFQKFVPVCFLLTFHHLFKLILENINNSGKGTTYTNGAKNDGKRTHADFVQNKDN